MSLSPNSRLVQRTIEVQYANKKRSTSLKWIAVNAVFLFIFVYDVSCAYHCPGAASLLQYVETAGAVVVAGNLVYYFICLTPRSVPRLPISPQQQKLLGLSNADLDSSFVLTKLDSSQLSSSGAEDESDDAMALWPRRVLARTPPATPQASPPRHSPEPPPSPVDEYLQRYAVSTGPPPVYQLAAAEPGAGRLEETSPQGSPRAWRRLDLDLEPQRLTQWNLNLRLWVHLTILERLTRELRAADEALARLALCEEGALRGGRVPPARLRALAHHVPALSALAPFLEPFPDQRYLLRRLHELAAGGCLSAYRWDGGGADWDAARPTDAELLLHLVATYLDGQLPGGGSARPFSAEYLVEGGAAAGKRLAIARLSARPPHYALVVGGALLDVARGRNNLLHALLLFLAAAARHDPPALQRTHLGRAGLNMLWIIGR